MNDQVAMSKGNGQLVIAVPLYRWHRSDEIAALAGYSLSLTEDKPIAYVVDCADAGCPLFNAEFVEKNFEFLGDL